MRKNHLTGIVLLILGLNISLKSVAQSTAVETDKEKKEQQRLSPLHVGISIGKNRSKFRDYATSPLIYNGKPWHLEIALLKVGELREFDASFSYGFGDFTGNPGFSKFERAEIYVSQLFQLKKVRFWGVNTKVGLMLNATGNRRVNNGLDNNLNGRESIQTLFGSIKFTKNLDRGVSLNKKLWFLKFRLKERKQNLAFRLNVGLVNSSYRNGYAYLPQDFVLNQNDKYKEYEFKLFSGFRMSSALDYTYYLKNKNALKLAYVWDAYQTGGSLDRFQMANHSLRFTLLFNTNINKQ